MGLGLAFLRDLVELKRHGALDNLTAVAEIGAQQLADSFLTAAELDEAYVLFRHPRAVLAPVGAAFWASLGLDHVAIDIDGDAVRLDLNRDDVPRNLRHAFGLVVNAGTTEHLTDQGNAFRVIHDLTRTGGVMYHEVPAGGLIDHGFVSYQPKFFNRIAQQNEYELLFMRLYASPPSPVPAYLLEPNYGMPPTVVDMTLRVAFRKRYRYAFSSPVDAAPHLIPPPRLPSVNVLRLWRLASRIKRAVAKAAA